MSRRSILEALRDGPKLWGDLRDSVEDRDDKITCISQSTLYRLLAAKVVGRTKSDAGWLYYIADPQIASRTIGGFIPRSATQIRTEATDGRFPRPLFVGTIFDDISINDCASKAYVYAKEHGSCVVVVYPDNGCTLYHRDSPQTLRVFADHCAHICGTWTSTRKTSRTARRERVIDIAEAIQHHIDLEAARSFAYGPTRGAQAPISTGVLQS